MTPEERALLRQDELEMLGRAEKATGGPWQARFIYRLWKACRDHQKELGLLMSGDKQTDWSDSEFCAAARADVPELLSRLAAARAGERELLERCTSICNQQLEAARQSGMFAGPLELARNNLVKLMAELFPVAESEKGTK